MTTDSPLPEKPLRNRHVIASITLMSLFLTMGIARTRIGTYWELPEALGPTLVLVVVQFLIFGLLIKIGCNRRFALTTTLFMTLMFFSYHVFMGRADMLAALGIWTTITAGGLYILYRLKGAREVFLQSIILYAGIFTLLNAALILYHYTGQRYDVQEFKQGGDLLADAKIDLTKAPDIYLIIQDAYASADTLKREFDYDNKPFIESLRKQGFYVAEDSRSYYSQTMLSVSSTLNLNYFQDDVKLPHANFSHRGPAVEYFLRPRLLTYLQQAGYDMHMTTSGYDMDIEDTGEKNDIRGSDFRENIGDSLLRKTPIHHILNLVAGRERSFLNPFRDHYELVRHQYESLRAQAVVTDSSRPRLVYAHILVPHPPFVFSSDGQLLVSHANDNFSYTDGKKHRHDHLYEGGWQNHYKKGYATQVSYANRELLSFIETLHKTPGERPRVVIIQGDHGSRLKEDFNSLKDSDMTEIFGVMNAVYFSDGDYRGFAADASPLNTLRLTTNKFLGTNLPLLANHQWFSTWKKPYDFIDVTGQASARK